MIEKFSDDEIVEIIKDLKSANIIKCKNPDETTKSEVMYRVKTRVGISRRYIGEDLLKSVYAIADECTNNKEEKVNKKGFITDFRRKTVPDEILEDYEKILFGVLETIKPYINKE